MNIKNLLYIALFSIGLSTIQTTHAYLLDVAVFLTEKKENIGYGKEAVTAAFATAVCQKASPIIVDSVALYNFYKWKQNVSKLEKIGDINRLSNIFKGERLINMIDITDQDWEVYRGKLGNLFLLIPTAYKKSIFDRFNTPDLRSKIKSSYLEYKDEPEKALLGFDINNLLPINPQDLFSFVQNAKKATGAEIVTEFNSFFLIGNYGLWQWNMAWEAHGTIDRDLVDKTPQEIKEISQKESKYIQIAGLDLLSFKKLMDWLITQMPINIFYYVTCYGGDITLLFGYQTMLISEKGNIFGGKTEPNFTLISAALTSQEVNTNALESLGMCLTNQPIALGTINYRKFFELLHRYGSETAQSPIKYTDAELREILNTVVTRLNPESYAFLKDPYGISGLPLRWYPGKFLLFPLNDKQFVLTDTLLKKHIAEKKPIEVKDKEIIAVYPHNIPVPFFIIDNKPLIPAMVSMSPGLVLHKFEGIVATTTLRKFINEILRGFNIDVPKYFYIKNLSLSNGEKGLPGIAADQIIKLKDVLMYSNGGNFELIFTDTATEKVYRTNNGYSLDTLNIAPKKVIDDSFLNAVWTYIFSSGKPDDAARLKYRWGLIRILSPEEKKLLDNARGLEQKASKSNPTDLSTSQSSG